MFGFRFWLKKKTKKKQQEGAAGQECRQEVQRQALSGECQRDLQYLQVLFEDNDLIEFRPVQSSQNDGLNFYLVYSEGVSDSGIIDEHIIKPLMQLDGLPYGDAAVDVLMKQVLEIDGATIADEFSEIVQGITYGDTLLLLDGAKKALLLNTKSFSTRAISEPEGEKTLSGPREGFTEGLMINLSMIRRRLRSNDLKMKYYNLGTRTHTQLCIVYLDEVVNKEILDELYRRLETIDIDGILDANYITELIKDNRWTPFRDIGYTERPDVVAGKILEGRIAIFVDGTPVVLTLPYLFIENFQSNEDYYLNFYYTSFSRMLRILGFFLTILVPSIYIAFVAYHHEVLPAPLMFSIAIERQNVPLPAALEAFLLLVTFDILRETGVRMPNNVGQALSIVGALVVGQAAVEAKLVAAPMIIVVAITGITSLLIPKMNAPILLARFMMLALSSCFGLLGVTLGFALLMAHILGLHSFGISQMTQDRELHYQSVKDTFFRAPWWQMRTRPGILTDNKTRQKSKGGRRS